MSERVMPLLLLLVCKLMWILCFIQLWTIDAEDSSHLGCDASH